jgi:hypothetical protein
LTHFLVIALYSKSTGKGSKHAAVSDADNVNALSNIMLQVYEHSAPGQLSNHTMKTSILRTNQFAIIQPPSLLMRLFETEFPTKHENGGAAISGSVEERLVGFQNALAHVETAIKKMKGRQKKGAQEDSED